jgi:hypothetical protein
MNVACVCMCVYVQYTYSADRASVGSLLFTKPAATTLALGAGGGVSSGGAGGGAVRLVSSVSSQAAVVYAPERVSGVSVQELMEYV